MFVWKFIDYANRPSTATYNGEKIHFHYDYGVNWYPINFMLTQPYPLSDYATESLILKYLADNHPFEIEKLSEKEKRNLRFWKYLDLSKLPTLLFYPVPILHKTILELSPSGVRGGYFKYNSNEIAFSSPYRLDNLFFEGPLLHSLLLEDRKNLRNSIFSALAPESGFGLKDAFPLFDYDKIEKGNWEFTNDNIISGEFVVLHSDRFEIGGWDNPRDAGATNHSIESIWAKRPNFVDNRFVGANDFIEKTLFNAIIKD